MEPALVALVADARNLWMWTFLHASAAVSRAVVAGRITVAQIASFTPYDPVQARELAVAAGLAFYDDDPRDDETADTEDITVAVEALRAIPAGDVGVQEGTWSFYTEALAEHGFTLEQVRQRFRRLNIAGAACLIVEADQSRKQPPA